MWVGTFHGICYRILRTNFKEVDLPKNFQIIDSDDQVRIIKRIMKDNEIENSQIIPKHIQDLISLQSKHSFTTNMIGDLTLNQTKKASNDASKAYQESQ